MIVLSLSDESIKHALNAKDAFIAWKLLNESYERNTKANKIVLRRQLYTLVAKEEDLDSAIEIGVLSSRLRFLEAEVDGSEKLTHRDD